MSVLIQIRDVDEGVRQRLKERASAEGVSLNALLKALLERESHVPPRSEVLRRLRGRGDLLTCSSADLVWSGREERSDQLDRH